MTDTYMAGTTISMHVGELVPLTTGHYMARLQIITATDFAEITSGCNVQSYQTTCYMILTWKTKAWHESTKCIDQMSFTDLEPKRIRKYDGTHVNMASYNTDSYMAETEL